MSFSNPNTPADALEPRLLTRVSEETDEPTTEDPPASPRLRRLVRVFAVLFFVLLLLAVGGFFYARHWVQSAVSQSLPQIDGTLAIPGLSAPVTVDRNAQGLPHIKAASIDDLLLAQGFVTAQDRLFQMDVLRRHAAGELAEVLGRSMVTHDQLQRTLQIRAAADRAVAQLPPAQLHMLERYAAGVNASIAAQSAHLPIEFRVLRYQPAAWTPRDSLLVSLAMFEDLTNAFQTKLAREALSARLDPALVPDLYPVGSWRDHPPSAPPIDLSIPGPEIPDIPLDESQSFNRPPGAPSQTASPSEVGSVMIAILRPSSTLSSSLIPLPSSFTPGSNNWAVSGAHTASGKPLLSNDMHLNHTLPGIWYESDLEADGFHAAGVTIPGLPLIVVGHNDHIAWGFTNLGGDVQDIYLETVRNTSAAEEFQTTDGSWQPVLHLDERIKVKGGKDIPFEVLATRHGAAITPILNPILTAGVVQSRTLALRWSIYDPSVVQLPTFEVDSAHDWPSFLAAFRNFGGPAQNVVYADDQGHIGFHVMGKLPLRGPAQNPPVTEDTSRTPFIAPSSVSGSNRSPNESPDLAANPNPIAMTDIQAPPTPSVPQLSGPLSPVPLIPTAAHEWSGYIPFDALPQVFDPPSGVVATANARVAPDDYNYPITLNWASAYRADRLYHLLSHATKLTPASMLAIQTDIASDFDRVLAERLTYALDDSLAHSNLQRTPLDLRTLKQASDVLRTFNGRMSTDSAAASILAAAHAALWPMLLSSHTAGKTEDAGALYVWGERDYALEQILMHQPTRWLPQKYATWSDFLTAALLQGLAELKAPNDLASWKYGSIHTVEIEHPIFEQSEALRYLLKLPTGTGSQPQSGDGTTIKQVGHKFGPSERFTADLANLQNSTLNIVLGQSGNPASPWFMDQFPAWLHNTTFRLASPAAHTLTLVPR